MTGLTQICRTRRIRGYAFPGLIQNAGYYLTDLKVFSDGLIECWEMVDLPMLKKKLGSGWVVTSVPAGESIGIHGLGALEFKSAEWAHTPRSLVKFLRNVIKDLNPRLENLYDCDGRDTEMVGQVRYAAVDSGNPGPWKTKGPITPLTRGEFGRQARHFRSDGGRLHLVTLAFFPDDTAEITSGPEAISLPSSELCDQLGNRDIFRLPEEGDRVSISQLGTFEAAGGRTWVDPKGLEAEICDIRRQVLGDPGVIEICMRAYRAYLEKQTKYALEALRDSYEAVPRHRRMYCGDMDVQDIPIRMILYGKDEIENWVHYQVAKQRGMDLPTIDIPDPPK